MLVSYHCHSRWSDGEGEVVDFIRAANAMGLDEVGLSDHYVIAPLGVQMSWAMPLGRIEEYVDDVQSAAGEAGESLIVRLGVEVDFFPETASEIRELLVSQPFDYVIGSVHRLNGFPIDDTAEPWDEITQRERNDIIRGYWVRVKQMAESGLFDIAAHLDLYKKFGHFATIDLSDEISAALDAIARARMTVEINTSGWFVPAREVYPAPHILQGCFEREIPIVINADAHKSENLIRGFDRARRYAWEIGYRHIASFAGRERRMHHMEVAL